MLSDVRFLLAIPLLQPQTSFAGRSPVTAILYLDSRNDDFWLNDDEVSHIVRLLQAGAANVWDAERSLGRLSNIRLDATRKQAPSVPPWPLAVADHLELLAIDPPKGKLPRSFNFDYTDTTPRAD
jgi:hypothetical protein